MLALASGEASSELDNDAASPRMSKQALTLLSTENIKKLFFFVLFVPL